MIVADTNPVAEPRVRWFHWIALTALLAIGAGLRFHQITKVGLWPDEFWSSVYLATGRGSAVFDLPPGVLVQPPPQTLLENAPSWWHIWTGLGQIVHPPVYLILLRWWMDIFGPSDFSTRAFSAIASLAAIVVLFDIVRRMICVRAALIAAALLAISPLQINLSQEARPYPLLALFGLLACHALFRIERQGASPTRPLQLGLSATTTALTHYFSLGALIAIFCHALLRLRGPDRRKTISALFISAILVLIVWGPFFWQQHREFFRQQSWSLDPSGSAAAPWIRAAAIPSALLYGRAENGLSWIAPAIIAYLLPLMLIRRYPQILLWWLWIVAIIASLVIYDSIHHARLLASIKYVSLASPALYALCAIPIPVMKSWRWTIPCLVLASVSIAAMERIQEGPPDVNGEWRGLAVALDHQAGPNDAVIFYPNRFWGSPGMYYLDFAHYAPNSHRPIMYLNTPADSAALRQLKGFQKIWLVGPTAEKDGPDYLPRWSTISSKGFPNSGSFAEMTPTSPLPSHPETQSH